MQPIENMKSAQAQWVRDLAVEIGFRRDEVTPLASDPCPYDFCSFKVCGITYEIRNCQLSIVNQPEA